MSKPIILVDAHVHVHPDCNLQLLLDSAAAHFSDAALKLGADRWQGALLLTEMAGVNWFEQVPAEGFQAGAWTVAHDPADELTVLARRDGRCILIVCGRQVVTREGIEVLTLGTRACIADGLTLDATLSASIAQSSLTVLPWAVGKWLGERGKLISEAILMRRASIFVGDNGGRPWLWPTPRQFVTASDYGSQRLSGSDPLALPGDEARVGSLGSWITGSLPEVAPGKHLLQTLRSLQPSQLRQYGELQQTVRFLRNQIGLRLRPKSRAAPRAPGDPETPDIETSSADYARRFSGAAGRYLLQVQSQSIRSALRGLTPGTVLDVGGGHGQLVDLLRELGWQVTVHGTDSACEDNLRNLHGKHDCAFLQSDLFALPVADQSFDLVIAVRLISHVEDWPRLVAELCRVSRQAVVIDYPAKGALNALTPLLFGLKKSLEGNTRTYTSFSRKELREQFGRNGFTRLTQVKQFLMPMVVHRVGKGTWPLRLAESFFRMLGLTALFGSPVILRVDRR